MAYIRKYAVIDADGYFGDFATVYSSHSTIAAAKRARRKHYQIIHGPFRRGDKVHRADIGTIYTRVVA